MSLLNIFIILIVLLFLVFWVYKLSSKQHLQLFRALFPSWRFFDEISATVQLYYRTSRQAEWELCNFPIIHSPLALFINDQGNFSHACNSLLQELVEDIALCQKDPAQKVSSKTSYALVRNLAFFFTKKKNPQSQVKYIQFKVCLLDLSKDTQQTEDILISPVYETNLE